MTQFVKNEAGNYQGSFKESGTGQVGDPAVDDYAGVHQYLAVTAFMGNTVGVVGVLQSGEYSLNVSATDTTEDKAHQAQGHAHHYGNAPGHPAIDVIERDRD